MLPLVGSRRARWGAADALPRRRRAEISVAAVGLMAVTALSASKGQAEH